MCDSSNKVLSRTLLPGDWRKQLGSSSLMEIVRVQLRWRRAGAAVARERRALRRLAENELRDIGITRAQVEEEARRDYFDLPHDRLKMYGLTDCGGAVTLYDLFFTKRR